MKIEETEVNAKQIFSAWGLLKTRLEFAQESLELNDTASASQSIECALALMDIVQGAIEDAPDEPAELDTFVLKIVSKYYLSDKCQEVVEQ